MIEKVNITNFMCHNRLVIDLGPKMNFVVGDNGSESSLVFRVVESSTETLYCQGGKSAILTAITIALGGKATSTSRASNLRSFVKEGKASSTVEVTLRNTGPEAFKPSLYPGKIIVERTIGSNGSGAWKIKNKDGKLVSTKRDDLNAICDHANIQVDNPMNILTQDAARQFLSASHADEKYQFFLRGTQLAQLASEYDIIQNNIQSITTQIGYKEQGLPLLREKLREKDALLNIVKKAADQRKKVEEYRKQLVWSVVRMSEDRLEAICIRVEGMKIKVEKASRLRDKAVEDERIHEEEITTAEKEKNTASEREAPLIDETKKIRDQEKTYLSKIKDAKDQERILNDQFKRLKAQIDETTGRIDAENNNIRGVNREERARLLHRQKQAEMEKKKAEKAEAEAQDQLGELESRAIPQLDSQMRALDGRVDRLRNTVSNTESSLKKLQVAKTNAMTAFGPNIPQLLQMIDREKRWKQKPVGPIGSLVKLKDARWAPVLESVIGNTLNAFCVTNHQDRNLLLELKARARCNEIPILTAADEYFDYSGGKPDESVLTILRVLDIESDYIKRQLINSVHIEKSALVSARAEGDILMRRRLRNVQVCFSLDMYRLGGGMGSSTMTLQPYKGPPRLSMDLEARIASMKISHTKEQDELSQVTNERTRLRQERDELDGERRRIKLTLIPTLRRQAREKYAEVERISEDLQEEEPANVQAMIEARRELQEEQQKLPDQLQDIHEIIEENEKKLQPLVEERMKIKKQLEQFRAASTTNNDRLAAAAKARLEAHMHADHWDKEVVKLMAKQDDLESSSLICEREVELQTKQAEEICKERVRAPKDPQEYEKLIEAAEKQLAQAAKRHGVDNVQTITTQVNQLHQAFEKASSELDSLKIMKNQLHKEITDRLEKWRQFRRIIAIRAKDAFSQYLSKRGYSGELTFDHNKGTLRLAVRTEEGSSGRQEKDPKSLSGGEKSFATICLLLALWESIGCPIRCLDEFDVFMDAVNRRISMAMMVGTFRLLLCYTVTLTI